MRLPRYWISRWGRDFTTVSMFTGRLFNYCLLVCLFSDVCALLSIKPFTNRQGLGYIISAYVLSNYDFNFSRVLSSDIISFSGSSSSSSSSKKKSLYIHLYSPYR